jgi:hypothetical protein
MKRGWIIAGVLASGAASTVLAQDGVGAHTRQHVAQARARQRLLDAGLYLDNQVQQAAAAAEISRPRSPRESAQRSARKSGGGGTSIFSKLNLPSLFPSRKQQEEFNDAPMPYDPPQQRAQVPARTNAPQGANAPQRNGQPAPRAATPTVRSSNGVLARQPARSTPQTQPQAQSQMPARTAPPVSRVARSSPTVSARRNELAEALSGLGDVTASKTAIEPTPEEQDVAPPTVEEAEELPSYLRESNVASKRTITAPKGRPAAQPRDFHDALLSEAPAEQFSEGSRDAAEAFADNGELADPPMPNTAEPRKSPANPALSKTPAPRDAQAKPRKPQPVEEPIVAEPEELGPIAADEPNPEFAVETPVVEKPAVTKSKSTGSAGRSRIPPRSVLFTSKQPLITSHIDGPQRIVVGRQAEYRVTVENKGDVAARELSALIAAPAGAEVVDAVASNGTVDRGAADGTPAASSQIKWDLYELAAGASQTLTVQLIPRSGREMQLGIQLSHAPVVAQATVEIQEPKLQMEIAGPAEVLYGKSQRYALTLSNPGNGAAEEVSIELTPPGGDKDSMVRHKVGTLAPGDSKKIELELTAREAGELRIQAAATAMGNLRTESIKTVMCRRPELQIDWRGPNKKYAGAIATYYFRVRNPGTAPADQVAVQCNLPAGAEMIEATEGHTWDADRRVLVWKGAGLNAGEERFMQVQCRMTQPGLNKMELSAQNASGDLSDAKSVAVTVEALADLKLEVVDPKGVIPVGELATYEIHIKNRGMTAAHGVNVVAMFSEGIDPSHVEGGQHNIRDGRVSFRTIDSLAAGAETVLKIHAKATAAGTHIFRTEVACQELEVKLAAEETTRFFTDDQRWADASTAYADEAQGTKTR